MQQLISFIFKHTHIYAFNLINRGKKFINDQLITNVGNEAKEGADEWSST